MKILNKVEFEKILYENPNKRYAFYEYTPCVFSSDLHITEGTFGAEVMDSDEYAIEPLFSFDWNIGEYHDNDLFCVLGAREAKALIQALTETL